MDDFYSAYLGTEALWRSRPPLLPEKDKQLQLAIPRSRKERRSRLIGTVVTLCVLLIVAYQVYITAELFDAPRDFVLYNFLVIKNALSLPFVLISPMVLLTTIVALTNFRAVTPRLNVTITEKWRDKNRERVNVILKPTQLPVVGLAFTGLLVLLVPMFASFEEFLFRDHDLASQWPYVGRLFESLPELMFVVAWSILAFGIIHLVSGVTYSEALVLAFIGGLYFATVYRYFGGLPAAVVAHSSYNIWAIGFMVSPELQSVLSRMLSTASVAINPKN